MGLLNWGEGLSELGKGVANTAGSMALEQQKSMLSQDAMKLADQLQGAREHTGRIEAGDIASAAEKQRFGSETALTTQREAATTGRTVLEGQNAKERTAAEIQARHQDVATTTNAPPPEVRLAEWYSKATPAQRQSYNNALLAKSGLPSWVGGGDNEDGPQPSKTAPVAPSNAPAPSPAAPGADQPPAPLATPPGKEGALPDQAAPLDAKIKDAPLPLASIKYNENALKGVPSADAGIIKQMVEGRMAPPTSFAMSKPIWRAYIAKANEYDPSFDATTWASRVATRKSFAAGPDAANINSINTALGHAERLYDNFDKQNNFGGILTPLNTPFNEAGRAMGSSKTTNVETDIRILSSEARKVFAGSGGGGLEELRNWEKSFPVNGSPTQQKDSLKEFSDLLGSRLNEMAAKYNRGMGTAEQPMNLLNTHAQQAYRKISGEAPPDAVGHQLGDRTPTPPQAIGGGGGWSIKPIE